MVESAACAVCLCRVGRSGIDRSNPRHKSTHVLDLACHRFLLIATLARQLGRHACLAQTGQPLLCRLAVRRHRGVAVTHHQPHHLVAGAVHLSAVWDGGAHGLFSHRQRFGGRLDCAGPYLFGVAKTNMKIAVYLLLLCISTHPASALERQTTKAEYTTMAAQAEATPLDFTPPAEARVIGRGPLPLYEAPHVSRFMPCREIT